MKPAALAAFIGAVVVSQGAIAHGPQHAQRSILRLKGWRGPEHSGQIDFACLLPGHFEAGMTGKVTAK